MTTDFNRLANVREGVLLYNRHDCFLGRSIELYGEFSHLEQELFAQICQPGDIVIDAGANIGAHTVALARMVGPSGRVLAFEPQRLIYQTLCANVALNSLANVDCHWAALGNERGFVAVPELDPNEDTSFGSLSLLDNDQGVAVPIYTLDQFESVPSLKLVKIDVEGMELSVLTGAQRIITKHRPILYVENDHLNKSRALMEMIQGMGYRMYWHQPPLFRHDNYYGNHEDAFPTVVSVNLLCVPKELTLDTGLTEATDMNDHPMIKGRAF